MAVKFLAPGVHFWGAATTNRYLVDAEYWSTKPMDVNVDILEGSKTDDGKVEDDDEADDDIFDHLTEKSAKISVPVAPAMVQMYKDNENVMASFAACINFVKKVQNPECSVCIACVVSGAHFFDIFCSLHR